MIKYFLRFRSFFSLFGKDPGQRSKIFRDSYITYVIYFMHYLIIGFLIIDFLEQIFLNILNSEQTLISQLFSAAVYEYCACDLVILAHIKICLAGSAGVLKPREF